MAMTCGRSSSIRSPVNSIAGAIDSHPLGAAEFALAAYLHLWGTPFDLSATRSFVRQFKEGDLAWPSKSPIDWPLKDWP